MRTSRITVAMLALAMACGGGGGGPTGTNNGGTTGTTGTTGSTGSTGSTGTGSTTNQIVVGDGQFTPPSTQVPVGTTVTWTWSASTNHNVTFTNTSVGDSPTQSTGTFSRTFGTAGTYGYRCTLHAGMDGTVVVQ